jgi:hypothetical protein
MDCQAACHCTTVDYYLERNGKAGKIQNAFLQNIGHTQMWVEIPTAFIVHTYCVYCMQLRTNTCISHKVPGRMLLNFVMLGILLQRHTKTCHLVDYVHRK